MNQNNKFITTYFRKSFNLDNYSELISLNISLLVDDGAVAYLNGNEIGRINMPDGAINYLTRASGNILDETAFTNLPVPVEYLIPGINTIAVEIHQSSATSSDMSFDCRLTGSRSNGSESAIYYTPEIEISFNNDITLTAHFIPDSTKLVDPLIISEINYNSSHDFDSGDWIEIYNNSGDVINMTGWQFSDTTNRFFEFPNDYLINPGEYLVLSADTSNFKNYYPSVKNILGDFAFGLKSEGELIQIIES